MNYPTFIGFLWGRMGRSKTTWTKENHPKGGRPKGSTNLKTDLLIVHKKLFSEPIVKRDEDGNVIKKTKLTPEQEIIAGMLSLYRDSKTPPQVKAKILGDLMGYLYTKPTQSVELLADVDTTVKNETVDVKARLDALSPEERDAYFKLCEKADASPSE